VRHPLLATVGLCVALLAGCSSSPVLLDAEGLGDVVGVEQNSEGFYALGYTWCTGMSLGLLDPAPSYSSQITLVDGGTVGATIVDPSSQGWSTQDVVDHFQAQADQCELYVSEGSVTGSTIEPLSGLGTGVVGWRTEQEGAGWGELAVVPLDGRRALVVGISSPDDDAPITLDDLLARAQQGAEQFPAGD
jgi:hypothetical protein